MSNFFVPKCSLDLGDLLFQVSALFFFFIRSGRKRRGKTVRFDPLGGAVSGCCTWQGIATRAKQQVKVGSHVVTLYVVVRSSRRSRPLVSKAISQPRSLGSRGPVDRAAGAALSLIDLTHVRVCYRATWNDFFHLSSIQHSGEDWRSLAFLSFSITLTDKNCSQTEKIGHASALTASVSELFQNEK